MTRPPRTQSRRVHAALLCVLWVLGFELGPGLHAGLHAALGHHHHDTTHSNPVSRRGATHGHDSAHEHDSGHGHDSAHEHEHDSEHAHGPTHGDDVTHEHDASHERRAVQEHLGSRVVDAGPIHELVTPATRALHSSGAVADESESIRHSTLHATRGEEIACAREDIDHGAHVLEHRGIAVRPASPPWPPVATAPWQPFIRTPVAVDRPPSAALRCARARGPPAS